MLAGPWRYIRQHHIALVALFIALGGTALALERNQVKSKHIAPGAVKRSDTNVQLRLKCPGGTRYHEGACIETAARPTTANLNDARSDCSDEGRRLPTLGELENFRLEPRVGLNAGEGEYTSELVGSGRGITVDAGGNVENTSASDSLPYRCVARPKR